MIFLPPGAEGPSKPEDEDDEYVEEVVAAPPPQTRTPSPGDTWAPLSQTGRLLVIGGIVLIAFVVFEFTATSLLFERNQVALLAAFKDRISATNLDDPAASVPEASAVAILTIPRIGVNHVVVEGTVPDDLKLGPGHMRNTPLPGEFGNSVLAGRRTTYGAPFARLDRLKHGNLIIVTTGQGTFNYVVSSVDRVPAGVADPLKGTLDSRLTLVTSDPEFYPSGRLVVVAMLDGSPASIATRPQVPITPGDTGLSGNLVGLVIALIWGQLMAAAIWLSTWLRRRMPRSVTLMFATPVVLALALLAFTSLDLALPGTL